VPHARPRRATARRALVALVLAAACSDATTANPSAPEPPSPTVRWSDPAAWPDGVVPTAGADVTVPAGSAILLDVSPPALGTLAVAGTLEFDRRDLELTARRVLVSGTLRVGSEGRPFERRAVITLTGTAEEHAGAGLTGKALAVLAGGTLELHGEPRLAWTRLAATANAGATQLTLERDVDWRAGDRVVVAASDFDPMQYDEAVVASRTGRTVALAAPLRFAHWGVRQTVAGRTVDERAEVGLLTRNVTVRGDSACAATGFCAHVIAFRGGTMRVEGVELRLVGQKFNLARYPIHWHMADDVAGQYARDNAIWRTFNRCVTVHGSHAATVSGNVCHDHLGHGYFLEDGVETRNEIAGNLGVLARAPAAGERLLASDATPASFWITHPDNTVRGNVAAGSQGWGFWYALPEHPTGLSATDAVWPRRTPLREFADNVAHSNRSGALDVDHGPRPDGTTETTSYAPRENPAAESPAVVAEFRRFTAYKHRGRAVWLRGRAHRLVDPVLADNGIGATFASSETYLVGGVIVGETANNATPFPAAFPVRGFEFYDGTVGAQGTLFANFVPSARGPASAFGYLRRNAFPLSTLNFAEGARYDRAEAVWLEDPAADRDGDKAAVFLDRDGSVTGTARRYVAANVPMLLTPACTARPAWNAHVCALAYGRLSLSSEAAGEVVAPATLTRDDGVSLTLVGAGNQPTSVSTSVPLGRAYTLASPAPLGRPRVVLRGLQPGEWARVALPFAAADLTAWRDYWTGNRVTAAASLAELDASAGDRYYLAGGVLHLKLVAQAGRDYAAVFVDAR
jgi:cell migration-inducing and hyaluronan-binding protein